MQVLKNAVGLTARLRPKRYSQENLSVTKTTIHRATLWSRHLRLWPFRKFQSRVYSKIFMPFQLKLANQISYIEKFLCLFKLKLTNQISYVSVGAEKMK